MGIRLHNIDLPDVVYENEFSISRVRAIVDTDLDGELNYWETDRPFTKFDLVGGSDFAWITRSVLLSLQALSQVPMATYVLNYEGNKRLVRFRHENEPIIMAVPLVARPNQAPTDFYRSLRIKLMDLGAVTTTTSTTTTTTTTTTTAP